MRLLRWTSASLGLVIGLLFGAQPADAIPSFARKYSINCSTCHQMNAPRLNALGRNFQEKGYQLPEGAERPVASRASSREDEKLTVLEQFPLSLRIKELAFLRTKAEEGENKLELNTPSEMQFLAGGALFHDVSFFLNFPFFTNGEVGSPILAYVQFGKFLGQQWSNLRVGKFNVLGFQFPNHRGLTASNAKAPAVEVGQNPVVLDDHQVGVQMFGRPNDGPFFYEVALVSGAEPAAGVAEGGHGHGGTFSTDANDFKDVFARMSYSTPGRMHTVGVLGYFGKSPLGIAVDDDHGGELVVDDDHSGELVVDDDHGGELVVDDDHSGEEASENLADSDATPSSGRNDRFRVLGVDGEFNLGALNLRSAAYLGHHSRPFAASARSVDYQSVLIEFSYALNRRLLGMAHYDQVFSSDLSSLEQRSITPHLSYLLLDNLRLSLEYHIDLDDFDRSRAFTLIDVSI